MSKRTRAEAARINGAKSKGPVTPEGKARSAQNAVRHGLAAQSISLSNEDRERCHAMLLEYSARLKPVGIVEEDLVEEMVDAKWRQRRAIAMANAAIDLRMDEDADEVEKKFSGIDAETRQVVAVRGLAKDDPNLLPTLHRYETSARRAYHKALRTLLEMQALRKAEESEEIGAAPSATKPARAEVVEMKLPNEPTERDSNNKKGGRE